MVEDPPTTRKIYPDVNIIEREPWLSAGNGGGVAFSGAGMRVEPVFVSIESETATEPFLTIIDPADGGGS